MSDPSSPRATGARVWIALAVALAVVAAVALAVAWTGQQRVPQPPRAEPSPVSAPSSSSSSAARPEPEAPVEPVAAPVALRIPDLDVSSDLLDLGLQPDGTVEVPPLSRVDQAGWYRESPAPGAVGPAVLLGHVDSAEYGPGVFFGLGALAPGAEVEVVRRDGSVAVFAVERVERYAKDEFPTLTVYGNTAVPELRLITCGGEFDPATRSYEDNIVAYATLVDVRTA